MRYVFVTAGALLVAIVAFLVVRHSARSDATGAQPAGITPLRPQEALPSPAIAQGLRQRHLEELIRETKLRPNDAAAHLQLAKFRLQLGHVDGARLSFERTLHLAPTSVAAFYGIAACCEAKGDDDGALKAYLEIAKRRPDDPGLQRKIKSAESALRGSSKAP